MATTRDASGQLCLGGLPLSAITVPTPFYAYDVDAIVEEAQALDAAFENAPHLVAYAVKANTAGTIVRAIAGVGCGADVVSGSELAVALACGIAPEKIVYSGVAKRDDEIDFALACEGRGICAIQVESVEEATRVADRAKATKKKARVSFRFNPELEQIDTHAHIATGHDEAKFGIAAADIERAVAVVKARSADVDFVGLTSHVGSQLTSTGEYVEGAKALFGLAKKLTDAGVFAPRFLDAGGGFGIDYGNGCPVKPADFVKAARVVQKEFGFEDVAMFVEPGRSLVAAHGVLVSRVIQPKVTGERRWLVVDAGMNDLVRPALYQARHRIVDLHKEVSGPTTPWRVVGPVCESSDDFGVYDLPEKAPEIVAILDAGAYGFTMASQYNGRAIPTEVFLRGGKVASTSEGPTREEWLARRLKA